MKDSLLIRWLLISLLIAPNLADAQERLWDMAATAQEKGSALAKVYKAREAGWVDASSELTMIIRGSNGSERVRKITQRSLEVESDGNKTLLIFSEPKDVFGTAFLSYSHSDKADDQWIYLPDLKRVKRISSNKKSGSFMGSEFAYEDLSSFEIAKYDFALRGEEELNGLPCYVLESFPQDDNSGYSKLVSWIDKKDVQFRKTEFYDRKETLLKVLIFYDYRQIGGKFWRNERASMENRLTRKSTELRFDNISLGNGLSDQDFTINSLKRAR